MKKKSILLIIAIGLMAFGVVAANQIALQSRMSQVLTSDPRNHGVEVSAHYGNFINPHILVFDIRKVAGTNSDLDVFRIFLQFADKMQSRHFDNIELAYKGHTKFLIRGSYFQQLGKEYSWQNPVYTDRTFPEHVLNPGGTPAYSTWEGGFLGVDLHQLQDFDDFHTKWWKSELAVNQ